MYAQDADIYPWYVRCYYGSKVKYPKRPGTLAIETKHKTEFSMRMEIQAGQARKDIDEITWGRR
jgi:hypothetical protein